ncbi:MAG: hypothetical protein ACREM2_05865 [Vulcanimicrobiaceae bacterium]
MIPLLKENTGLFIIGAAMLAYGIYNGIFVTTTQGTITAAIFLLLGVNVIGWTRYRINRAKRRRP